MGHIKTDLEYLHTTLDAIFSTLTVIYKHVTDKLSSKTNETSTFFRREQFGF